MSEEFLGCLLLITVVDFITVKRDIGDDLVFEQGTEILLAGFGVEEEGVGARAKARPRLVGGREDGAANHGDVVDVLNEVGLVVGEEEGGELGREEADLLADVGRGNKNSVDSVDDTVLGFLESVSPDQRFASLSGYSQS